ncbi:MAG: glycosyltransferase family 8 protein, partial [Bacilli bacterium]
MEKLHFLYTADSNYFNHMLTSLYSLAIHHFSDDVVIHIIEDSYTKEQLMELKNFQNRFSNIELKLYPIDSLIKQMELVNISKYRNSYMPNARLFISELIDVDKILYIDSDTIIDNSLKDIFKLKTGKAIGAVKEAVVPVYMKKEVEDYYNSGVLIIDLEKFKENDCLSKIVDTTIKSDIDFLYPDQDILNIALSEDIVPIDFSYNIFPSIYNIMKNKQLAKIALRNSDHFYTYQEIENAIANPHIYHLLTVFKNRPWNKNSINPYNEMYDFYRKYWDANYTK